MLLYLVMLSVAVALTCLLTAADSEPIRLHPDNPHYFLFGDKPTLLITSGEHYGAVLNLDFDYVSYLDTLKRDGMNATRTFPGAYLEPEGAFGIARNSLAPASGRLICPWARSDTPGYAHGGNKFDLTRWDDAYFARLRDFVVRAAERGVVVELSLFCPFYEDTQWALSPMNARNNVNGFGNVERTQAYTLDRDSGLYKVQEAMVRKLVSELKDFDNLYYEIMNEPYWGNLPPGWQRHIAEVIADTEKDLGRRHLIAQNIANDKAKVDDPDPLVSIFSFHYAFPPETVGMNWGLNRVIGDNETGFKGTADLYYRREAWAIILAGAALYNNLDYSFTVGHEDGTFAYPPTQPGGGGPALRKQLRILRDFITSFDFIRMQPATETLKTGAPEGVSLQALALPGEQYAVYLYREEDAPEGTAAKLQIQLPAGRYKAEWVDTLTGEWCHAETLEHTGGECALSSPAFAQDIALRLIAQD